MYGKGVVYVRLLFLLPYRFYSLFSYTFSSSVSHCPLFLSLSCSSWYLFSSFICLLSCQFLGSRDSWVNTRPFSPTEVSGGWARLEAGLDDHERWPHRDPKGELPVPYCTTSYRSILYVVQFVMSSRSCSLVIVVAGCSVLLRHFYQTIRRHISKRLHF